MKQTTYYIAQEWTIEGDTTGMSPEARKAIDSIVTSYIPAHTVSSNDNEESPHFLIMAILSVLVIFGAMIGFSVYNSVYWNKGVFPPFSRFKRLNHYEAIVYIAVRFMLCDRDSYSNKLVDLSRFLKAKFPEIGNPMDTVKVATETPVSVESVSAWFQKHLSLKEKQELFEFFGDMALSDGGLGRREFEYLSLICRKWQLGDSLLRSVEEKAREKQKREEVSRPKTDPSEYMRRRYAKILEIDLNASSDVVKKAYRKLAMRYHPDRMQSSNEYEKEAAKVRFLEIQEAYEYFLRAV